MHRKNYILFLVVSCCLTCFGQHSDGTKLLQTYDANSDANLALYNGKLYYFGAITPDQATNNAYLLNKNEFTKGDIGYDGQSYYDVELKYDIFNDILLVRPKSDQSANIELIREKVSDFYIYGKHFVNVKAADAKNQISGYFMESVKNRDFGFYVKYRKTVRQVEYRNRKVSDFRQADQYYVLRNATLQQVKSQPDIVELFPQKADAIAVYFKTNKQLLKDDETAFMEKLFRQLDNTSAH